MPHQLSQTPSILTMSLDRREVDARAAIVVTRQFPPSSLAESGLDPQAAAGSTV